jgi:hypothetical protein
MGEEELSGRVEDEVVGLAEKDREGFTELTMRTIREKVASALVSRLKLLGGWQWQAAPFIAR